MEQNQQRFIPVPEHDEGLSALTVSTDRTLLAIAEASKTKPSIHIFDLHSFRKRKTLYAESISANVIKIGFNQLGIHISFIFNGFKLFSNPFGRS